MKNFEILNNFPKKIIKNLKEFWEINKDAPLVKGVSFRRLDLSDKELESFKREMNIPNITHGGYYVGAGHQHLETHIDGRPTSLNIPIELDLDNSFFYSSKNPESYYAELRKDLYKLQKYCASRPYNDEQFEKYNVETPILINTHVPHGMMNFSDKRRVLFGITFKDTKYEDVLKTIPTEWL